MSKIAILVIAFFMLGQSFSTAQTTAGPCSVSGQKISCDYTVADFVNNPQARHSMYDSGCEAPKCDGRGRAVCAAAHCYGSTPVASRCYCKGQDGGMNDAHYGDDEDRPGVGATGGGH